MDVRDILLFVATLVNLGFASAILFKNPRSRINISYSLSVVSTALWTLGLVMFRLLDADQGIFWARFYYISAGLIATYFLYFGIYFPRRDGYRLPLAGHFLLHIPIAVISYIVFTPSFIEMFRIQSWGREV